MKKFNEILSEVARAVSPADKEFVALHRTTKKQFVDYPESQFKGTTGKDKSKMVHPSNETGVEDEIDKEKPLGEEEIEQHLIDVLGEEAYGQLDEISKQTLGSYIKKASQDVAMHMRDHGAATQRSVDYTPNSDGHKREAAAGDKALSRSIKRSKGIARATDKLTKEELEEKAFEELAEMNLQEISKKTLRNYIKHSKEEQEELRRGKEFEALRGNAGATAAAQHMVSKRRKGMALAKKKLGEEETLDESVLSGPYREAYKEAKPHIDGNRQKTLHHMMSKMSAGDDEASTFGEHHFGEAHEKVKSVLSKHGIQTK